MDALTATIVGTWRHLPPPWAPHSPRASPRSALARPALRVPRAVHVRSVQGMAQLPGSRRWQPRACLAAGRAGKRHLGVPEQRARNRMTLALESYPAFRRHLDFPRPRVVGMTPDGGSGVFTILVPVWCHGLLLASHVLVYVSDRSWARTFHLPGQRHVALGIQCVFKTHIHCDRKIMAALHKDAWELRCHVKALDNLWKQPLLQPKASRSSLGVTLDLTGLGDVQKGIGLFVAGVIAGWACDAFYLAKLVTIWSVQGWEPVKYTILNKEQRPMLNNLLDSKRRRARGPAPDLEDHPEDEEQQLEEGGRYHLVAWSRVRCSRHLSSAWLQRGSRRLASSRRERG